MLPEIDAGVGGAILIASVLALLLKQELFAVTEITPEINVEAKDTGKLVLLVIMGDVPEDEVTPLGNIHV